MTFWDLFNLNNKIKKRFFKISEIFHERKP